MVKSNENSFALFRQRDERFISSVKLVDTGRSFRLWPAMFLLLVYAHSFRPDVSQPEVFPFFGLPTLLPTLRARFLTIKMN